MKRIIVGAALVFVGIAGTASVAGAQEKPCMADAARLCPDVAPGSAQIMCLKQHKESLSPACKKRVMQAKIKHEEQKQLQQQQEQQQPMTPQPTP